ncbi:MAG: NFACT family protein [Clostridia bacterium]|nr:NFACT family protein [Clostridia bacterium]
MAFDGFVTNAVIAELKKCLLGGKVTKIYEPNKNEILLGIYAHHLKYALCLNISSSHYGAYLTTNAKPNPLNAPNFCMTLRKHLIGYKVKDILCHGLERIITIELEGYNELNDVITKKLIVELMGKHSNVILVNEKNNIIDALRHFDTFSGALRNILPGYEYSLPQANKADITQIALDEILQNSEIKNSSLGFSSYVLTHFAGISKQLLKSSMKKLALPDILTYDHLACLFSYLLRLYQACQEQKVSLVSFEEDYTLEMKEKENSLAVNFFLDDFYMQKELQEELINYRNSMLNVILNKLKKIQKKLIGIDEKLKECNHIETYQLYGELITSYLYQLNSEHVPFVKLKNYYDNNNEIKIPLDVSLSPAENAKKYFKKYHKLKNTQEIVSKQKIKIEKEINYLESIVYELQIAQSIRELDSIYDEIQGTLISSSSQGKEKNVKRNNEEIKILKYIIDGFTILVGKNNQQNDYLTTKLASSEDLWFHTQGIHGSHVILKTEGKKPSQETINQVAAISAYYSKANQSSNVPVDYTYVKYVKKPSKSKPGMVVYSHQQTVNVIPKSEKNSLLFE